MREYARKVRCQNSPFGRLGTQAIAAQMDAATVGMVAALLRSKKYAHMRILPG
jgi:hypothetical protein